MRFGVMVFEAERDKLAPGTKLLVKRAREMGHRVSILHEENIQVRFGNSHALYHKGKPLEEFDAIIARPGIKADPSIHAAILRQVEHAGYLVINGYLGVHRAKNKIRTLQILDHFNLPIPRTVVIYSAEEIESITSEFSFPIIVKAAYGAGGTGTFIAESKRSLKPLVEFILQRQVGNDPVKVQEYIKESKGKDIRIFVIGKKVAAAMERSAQKGEFRSNLHRGGSGKGVEVTEEEARIAIEATKRLGLDFSGVDVLRTNDGPMIIEVNSYPGLEGIMKFTGVDVAGKIVKYVEKRAKKHASAKGRSPQQKEKPSKKSEA